jgi:hypothetical protein
MITTKTAIHTDNFRLVKSEFPRQVNAINKDGVQKWLRHNSVTRRINYSDRLTAVLPSRLGI